MSRFLEYTPDVFLPWLCQLAGRRSILDVGCGRGFLTVDLRARGHEAVGIDTKPMSDVARPYCIVGDAQELRISRAVGKLVVLAQPRSAPWMWMVATRARSDVLFIGPPSTFEAAAQQHAPRPVTRIEAPGLLPVDGEPLGAWMLPRDMQYADPWYRLPDRWMRRLTKLGPRGAAWTPEWAAANGGVLGCWVNNAGGGWDVNPSDPAEGPVWAVHPEELDWSDVPWVKRLAATRWDHSTRAGWLSPRGEFHACSYADHAAYARYVLGWEDEALLEMGWGRVHAHSDGEFFAVFGDAYCEPNAVQRAAIQLLNDSRLP